MKKFIFSMLFVLALIISVKPALALDCKNGNFGSDECWTNVQVSPIELSPVTVGTILVYDMSGTDADDDAFKVRVATTSADSYKVAGVAQSVIATGDRGNVLVRGKGKLRVATQTSTGDRLFAAAVGNFGAATPIQGSAAAGVSSHDKVVAWALQANTTGAGATIDAYISVL